MNLDFSASIPLARVGPDHSARNAVPPIGSGHIGRIGQMASMLRRVGPQHARDLGLRAEVDCTEASKRATPRSADS